MKSGVQPIAIGITGGIGSGKSEVCNMFRALGASVLVADTIAKELVDTKPDIKKKIQKQLGDGLFSDDGTLIRKQMAKLIFADDTAREKLNAIVHPFVLEYIGNQIIEWKRAENISLIVVEAALMYEAKAETMFDYVVAVDADVEQRIKRVMNRDQTTRSEVLQRMNAQMPAKNKTQQADFTIRNVGDRRALEEQCKFLFNLFKKMSLRQNNSEKR